MGCETCSVNNGKPNGCKSNGNCMTGGCNKLNTYDWFSHWDIHDTDPYPFVEISFKNGSRKDFYKIENGVYETGNHVIVKAANGFDLGTISLSGELVRLQMKRKKITEKKVEFSVVRSANEKDLERLSELRGLEKQMLVRARAISRTLGIEMKIGDIEYQGDAKKATFYYTAEGRIDFRELVRSFAREFRIKIEMRQIGSRQESGRIGGIGSCGRELCCSTWLTDFKSVSTTAARYQNLAINQAKLTGQCGRLKCCLNYELDTYMEALSDFPDDADTLQTTSGKAKLIKLDIFKGLMYYLVELPNGRIKIYPMDKNQVKRLKTLNKKGKKVDLALSAVVQPEKEKENDYEVVSEVVELPAVKKSKRRKKRRKFTPRNKKPRS
jgi:cell fate regulator YaaT (PSP1 superfamily)